jgi:hypothetical protein
MKLRWQSTPITTVITVENRSWGSEFIASRGEKYATIYRPYSGFGCWPQLPTDTYWRRVEVHGPRFRGSFLCDGIDKAQRLAEAILCSS